MLPPAPQLSNNTKNWLFFFGGVATVIFLVKVTEPEVEKTTKVLRHPLR